jgi:hypothetical protein
VQRLGREGQVLLERRLFKQLRPSPYVPHLLATPIDSDSVALVLNCVLAGASAAVTVGRAVGTVSGGERGVGDRASAQGAWLLLLTLVSLAQAELSL